MNRIQRSIGLVISGALALETRPKYCLRAVRQVIEHANGWEERRFFQELDWEKYRTPENLAQAPDTPWARSIEEAFIQRGWVVPVEQARAGDPVFSRVPEDQGHVGLLGTGPDGQLWVLENAEVRRGQHLRGALNWVPLAEWLGLTTVGRLPDAWVFQSAFERAHGFTAEFEGGYVNHPSDPGGETNLGVTRRVWERWCKAQGRPVKVVRSLTLADVLPLYQAWYWAPLAASLPWPLSAAVYDLYVNHGPGNAKRMLDQAQQARPDSSSLVQALALTDVRERFYRGIVAARPSQQVFMKGWLRRVHAQRAWLKGNAEGEDMPSKVFIKDSQGKNIEWDGKPTVYGGVTLRRYPDGAVQLERVKPAVDAQSIPATPQK